MDNAKKKPRTETLAVHAGVHVEGGTGAVAPSITLSTTFQRAEDGTYPHGYIYSRSRNPNRDALEDAVCALEGGAAAAAFASGSAATAAIFTVLSPGDHVIAPDDAYYGTARQLGEVFSPWDLQPSFIDLTDLAQVERAIRPNTRLLWVETPSNPLLKISDIEKLAAIAHRAGALLVCDNTLATPVLQRPFELGADLIMHSSTKYLGGHSDILGGVVVARQDDGHFQKIRTVQGLSGAVPSPFECWLTVRSISTLPYRMQAHSINAQYLANFLRGHSAVEAVHYPGLSTHPGYALAKKQMRLSGGLLSFQVRGEAEEALQAAARLKVITHATSLGGVESLIDHRASVEGPTTRTPKNLLRLSVGLEHYDDLIDDLAQALAQLQNSHA
ncbi:MAG: aminotransferase class V-fold PLP-dependent enzyme [Chloroflexota bacterium]|nr:aminotransferase class V-fold PLP-dependent enzyme [Chloroflexota bacterium]